MIVFVSNYYNHHQAPFSEAIYRLTDGEYRFIATATMESERISMGWGGDTAPFVLEYDREAAVCQKLIDEADVVIYGSAPARLLQRRLEGGKLTLMYSERPYKEGFEWYKLPIRLIRNYKWFGRYKNLFLLCASGYTASDYAITGTFLGKAYKWGYFPMVKEYGDIRQLLAQKRPASILWVARFIRWKHPEIPIQVAQQLKKDGYQFHINMIGNGELTDSIRQMILVNGLEDCVHLLGAMKPMEVRKHMEGSKIFLFTSDRNEGWGAVLNEAMNSGCAVIADSAIGSVPFLMEDQKNGLTYTTGDFQSLYHSVKTLLDRPQLCDDYGAAAYHTVATEWNAEIASARLLTLIGQLADKGASTAYQKGPCSKV